MPAFDHFPPPWVIHDTENVILTLTPLTDAQANRLEAAYCDERTGSIKRRFIRRLLKSASSPCG